MNKKVIMISNMIIIALYAVIEVLCCFGAGKYLLSVSPAVLFTGALVLFTALLTLDPKYRKTRKLCIILAFIDIVCAVVFSINAFHYGIKYFVFGIGTTFFTGILVTLHLCLLNIDAYKNMFITKITSSMGIIMLFLISLVHCINGNEIPVMSTSAALVSCAIAINLLVPKLRNKTAQIIVSIASLAFLALPVLYLIRGYWGFTGAAINALLIGCAVIALVCTLFSAVLGIKNEKRVTATFTAAQAAPVSVPVQTAVPVAVSAAPSPVSPVTAAPVTGWVCPKCSYQNNDDPFCANCGYHNVPKTETAAAWNCPNCGTNGNCEKFCENCGAPKPVNDAWNCPNCGRMGNIKPFCGQCGSKKP